MSKRKGLFAGLAIGATLGILFAPKKGEDTRKDLTSKMKELWDKAKELEYDLAVEKGTPVLEKAAKDVKEKTVDVLNDLVKKLESDGK